METMDYSKDHPVEIENGDTWYVGLAESNWAEVVVPVNSLTHMTNEEIGATVRMLADEADFIGVRMMADYMNEIDCEVIARQNTHDHLQRRWADMARYAHRADSIDTALKHLNRAISLKARMHPGFIYVIRCGPYFKIGRTIAVGPRMAALGIQLPHAIEVVVTANVDDMIGEERRLHKLFESKRMNGEWFALDDLDIQTVRDMYELN